MLFDRDPQGRMPMLRLMVGVFIVITCVAFGLFSESFHLAGLASGFNLAAIVATIGTILYGLTIVFG